MQMSQPVRNVLAKMRSASAASRSCHCGQPKLHVGRDGETGPPRAEQTCFGLRTLIRWPKKLQAIERESISLPGRGLSLEVLGSQGRNLCNFDLKFGESIGSERC
jgi:hypothetical protein